MPVKVVKRGSKYGVTDPKGRVYGTHTSNSKAQAQRRAIEANTRKK